VVIRFSAAAKDVCFLFDGRSTVAAVMMLSVVPLLIGCAIPSFNAEFQRAC